MKKFIFDTLVDKENICNLTQEREVIQKSIALKEKLIVYAPRNFGKTSLVKSVVIPSFRKLHKKNFVLFADLMGVSSWESIERRMERSFAVSFAESFPAKKLIEETKRFIASLRPQISIDEKTGSPAISLTTSSIDKPVPLDKILKSIGTIAQDIPTLVALDEFQDIAFVEEAQARFRQCFQELGEIPMIIMGSKQHILANIFAKPESPLASFGKDIEFGFIPYEEYHQYIEERFRQRDLSINFDASKLLQDMLYRIPEPINIVCAHLFDTLKNVEITEQMMRGAIEDVVKSRQSRYEQFLAALSDKEEQVLVALAKCGPEKHYNSKAFLKAVSATSRTVGVVINKLLNTSIVDKTQEGYRVSDPLLCKYLRLFR